MGNTFAADTLPVLVTMVDVHNAKAQDLFYYCHVSSGGPSTKVIGRSQTLSVEVGVNTILTLTVYECPEPAFTPENARAVGILRVPIEHLAERYSSGIFHQWFNLDVESDPRELAGDPQSVIHKFEDAYRKAVVDVNALKICVSLIGSTFEVQSGSRSAFGMFVAEDVRATMKPDLKALIASHKQQAAYIDALHEELRRTNVPSYRPVANAQTLPQPAFSTLPLAQTAPMRGDGRFAYVDCLADADRCVGDDLDSFEPAYALSSKMPQSINGPGFQEDGSTLPLRASAKIMHSVSLPPSLSTSIFSSHISETAAPPLPASGCFSSVISSPSPRGHVNPFASEIITNQMGKSIVTPPIAVERNTTPFVSEIMASQMDTSVATPPVSVSQVFSPPNVEGYATDPLASEVLPKYSSGVLNPPRLVSSIISPPSPKGYAKQPSAFENMPRQFSGNTTPSLPVNRVVSPLSPKRYALSPLGSESITGQINGVATPPLPVSRVISPPSPKITPNHISGVSNPPRATSTSSFLQSPKEYPHDLRRQSSGVATPPRPINSTNFPPASQAENRSNHIGGVPTPPRPVFNFTLQQCSVGYSKKPPAS